MAAQQLTHNPRHFKLDLIIDKFFWCVHRPTLTYAQIEIQKYNERTEKKTEKLRLNARNTALCIIESIVNSYNSGECQFIVFEDGRMFYETSKFLAKELYLSTCDDARTAEQHLKRIQLAIDNGCKIFLSYRKTQHQDKKHRFDCNARFEINPELMEIIGRRERFKK